MYNGHMEVDKEKIKSAFSDINLDELFTLTKRCVVCKKLINDDEHDAGSGACFKCWDK